MVTIGDVPRWNLKSRRLYEFLMDSSVFVFAVKPISDQGAVRSLAADRQVEIAAPSSRLGSNRGFEVHVVFTDWRGTRAAMQAASRWARFLRGQIVLWCPQVVPHQVSLTSPPISTPFLEQGLESLALACCENSEIMIRVRLCRDTQQCLLNLLDPEAGVLVGGKKRWLPTQEQKWAAFLHSSGLRVLFMPIKEDVPSTPAA
jgi:hypothetical protein